MGSKRLSDKVGIYLCHKYSGAGLEEIGKLFGIGESAVSQSSRSFELALEGNGELRGLVGKVLKKLELLNVSV